MKTFEQFLNDRGDDPAMIPCEGWIDGNEYKAIQLESYKAGLKAAADECKPGKEDYRGGSTGNARGTSEAIKQAILTLHDRTTELPKE